MLLKQLERRKRDQDLGFINQPELGIPFHEFDAMGYQAGEIMGYQSNWLGSKLQKRIPLTINAGQVPSTQTDFSLLFDDKYDDLIGAVEAELRFAGSDNIQLPYEIEKFDNVDGALVAWAKKPTVSDDDFVGIYFDNPGAVDEQDSGLVWSDYNAVYHLNQTIFGASTTLDSSPNNESGTPQNMAAINQVPGQIDGSLEFDGIDEFVLMSSNPILDPGTGSWFVSAWIKPDTNTRKVIVGKQEGAAPNAGWSFRFSNTLTDRRLLVSIRDNTGVIRVRGDIRLTLGVLHHVVFTYDGSGNASGVRIFVNGVEDVIDIEADTLIGEISTNIELNIGDLGEVAPTSFVWNGNIDEVNMSGVIKPTPDFITTIFNNQNNPSAFYTTGAVETIPKLIGMGYTPVD